VTASDLATVYPDGILMTLLRAPLAAAYSAAVGTLQPADVLARLPYLVAREVAGGGDADDRFAQAVSLQLDGYAADLRAARQLVSAALLLLRHAQQAATVTPDGYLAALTVTAYPAQLREPDQPDGMARVLASCTAVVRPAN
jgi:hypothetical protein